MMSSGMFDAYLIAQALGWEWNFWTMIVISFGPIIIIGLIVFIIFFVIPFLLDLFDR